jgi:hypothetical protein
MEYLENNDPRHKSINLKDLYEYMSFDKLKVHSKIVGKGKKHIKQINEFIVKKRKKTVKKNFKLQHLISKIII